MKFYLLSLLTLVTIFPSVSLAVYLNPQEGRCLEDWGESHQINNRFTYCGEIQNYTSKEVSKEIQRRRDGRYSLNFSGVIIRHSNLEKVNFESLLFRSAQFYDSDLSDSIFRHADLRNSIFERVRSKGMDLSSADLRGADLRALNETAIVWTGALIDQNTALSSQITCEDKKEIGLKWMGDIPDPCAPTTVVGYELPSDILSNHPGALAFKENELLRVLPSLKIKFVPVSNKLVKIEEFGLNRWDRFEILCAAKVETCLKGRKFFADDYSLRQIPQPVLHKGLEFYHGEVKYLEKRGQARFVAFNELVFNEDNASSLVKQLQNKLGKNQKIQSGKWIDRLESVSVLFNFLEQPQISKCEIVQYAVTNKKRIKCKIIMDIRILEEDTEQWMRQLTQGWIRLAQTSTATVTLKFHPNYGKPSENADSVSFAVPIKNINFWELRWGKHYLSN